MINPEPTERLYLRARLALANLPLMDEAATAAEARGRIAATPTPYHLAIVDLAQTDMDGWALVAELQARADFPGAMLPGDLDAVRIPLPEATFDCVYSLRTLPHLGHDGPSSEAALTSALEEVGRVLAPGGVAVLELENARSPIGLFYELRQLGSHLRPAKDPAATAPPRGRSKGKGRALEHGPLVIDSPRGVTRLDVLSRVVDRLPPTLVPIDLHGLRIVTASPHLLAVPLLGRVLARLEWLLRDQALIRRLAAQLLLVLRRPPSPPAAPDPGLLVSGPQPLPPRG